MIRTLETAFAALAGLAFGSFLNVFVTRWPEGESVVRPRSHCRNCHHALPWWENIPLFSWLLLRGRCRSCRQWIGWRYPIVEAAVGALWACAAWHFLQTPFDEWIPPALVAFAWTRLLAQLVFLWLLVALAALDAENLWLPDKLTLPGMALGFLLALARPLVVLELRWPPLTMVFEKARFGIWTPVVNSLFAAIAAAGFLLLVRWLYRLLRRREGLGLGDVKLMAMIAAWLGLRSAILTLVLAALLGTLAALALLLIPAWRRDSTAKWAATPLPFGAFLCLGGIVSSLWGAQLIQAYLHWAGI